MSFLTGPAVHWSHKAKTAATVAAVVAPVALLLAGFALYRPPAGVRDASRVLEALGPENKVGEVWGLDVFLEKKGAELLTPELQRPKTVMTWLFAAKIIETAAWDRPLDDLKYAFYVMRQEGVRRMSAPSVFLMDLKESLAGSFRKTDELDKVEADALGKFREETLGLSREAAERKSRELLAGDGSRLFKAQLAARAAFLREQLTGERATEDLALLESCSRKAGDPFFLVLAGEALRGKPPVREKEIAKKMKRGVSGETGAVLAEYQNALELLSVRDYNGFVERLRKMVVAYPGRDFSPVLLYQAWGVLKYDLHDVAKAGETLSGFKADYPVSELSKPEQVAGIWDSGKGRVIKGPAKAAQPPSFLRNSFNAAFIGVVRNIKRFTADLKEGQVYEREFDEKTVNEWLGDFLPPSAKKILTGYKVGMTGDGLDFYAGVKFGAVNFSLNGRSALVTEPGVNGHNVKLKVRELKLQNLAVPRFFMDQIERDFNSAWQSVSASLDVFVIEYQPGGMKVSLRKKPSALTGLAVPETVPVPVKDNGEKRTADA